MINILSYVGMNMQSEICLWCLLGLVRTIFDATLFKVNANLKQVWQMKMPEELSKPVQRALRTMVSGIMLVQCFTVYVYLAAYIVLLYPVFLEERPALVLPWLLLAAVRKLLCELTSLALGLGTCLLLGPARQPCIKFVIVKFASIIPAFYMWMLVFSYYHTLKVAAVFKTFPAILPHSDNDYGLELAVRRRRTKSLLGEDQLRKKLVANFYGERSPSATDETHLRPVLQTPPDVVNSTDTSIEEGPEADVIKPPAAGWSDIGAYVHEDWFGSEITIPRDTDRILEQFVLMLLRIARYLKKGDIEAVNSQIFNSTMATSWHPRDNIDCNTMNPDATETPPHIGSSKGNIASYLREYPQIFMKKQNTGLSQTELTFATLKAVHSLGETDEGTTIKNKEHENSLISRSHEEMSSAGFEKVPSKKKIIISDSITTLDDKTIKLTLPPESQTKSTTKVEETKLKSKLKKHCTKEEIEKYASEIVNIVLNNVKSKTSAVDFKEMSSGSEHLNKTKKIRSTETLNNINCKKRTHIAILDTGYTETNPENKLPKERNDDVPTLAEIEIREESLIQHKQLNTADVSKEISYTTILNEITNQESEPSIFLNAYNNDGRKSNSPDDVILKENNSQESTHCKLSYENHEELGYDSKISKPGTSCEIPKDNSYLKEKRIELISKDETNYESPHLPTKYDDMNRGSLDIKTTNRDSEIKIVRSISLIHEDKNVYMRKEISNKELPLRVLPNDNNEVVVNGLDKSKIKCLHCKRECDKIESVDAEVPLRIHSSADNTKNLMNIVESSKDETKSSTDHRIPQEIGCKKSECNCRNEYKKNLKNSPD